jgi:hypothetical protein
VGVCDKLQAKNSRIVQTATIKSPVVGDRHGTFFEALLVVSMMNMVRRSVSLA